MNSNSSGGGSMQNSSSTNPADISSPPFVPTGSQQLSA